MPTPPIPLTDPEFFQAFIQILRDRLGGKPSKDVDDLEKMGPSKLDTQAFRDLAKAALQALPPAPGGTGSCTYVRNGTTFCIENVTNFDCDTQLHGTFNPSNVCDPGLPPWP